MEEGGLTLPSTALRSRFPGNRHTHGITAIATPML